MKKKTTIPSEGTAMLITEILASQASALESAAIREVFRRIRANDNHGIEHVIPRHAVFTGTLLDRIAVLRDAMQAYGAARDYRLLLHARTTPSRQAALGAQLRVERRCTAVLAAFAAYLEAVADVRRLISSGMVTEHADEALAYAPAVLYAVLADMPRDGVDVRHGYIDAHRLPALPDLEPTTPAGRALAGTLADRIYSAIDGRPIADPSEVPF